MNRKIAIVVAMAFGIFGAYFLWQSFSNPLDLGGGPGKGAGRDTQRRGEAGVEAKPGDGDLAGDSSRIAVPREASTAASTDASLGSLLVRVRWPDDQPAPGIVVTRQSRTPIFHTAEQKTTDAEGQVRFENLPVGEAYVTSDRGRSIFPKIVAGKVTEATMKLTGVDVHGVVVDAAGRGVAGAGIWLTAKLQTGWLGGRVVGRSAENGGFRLRAVPKGQSLGALAQGHAPSELVDLDDLDTTTVPVQVRLVVDKPGGAVQGVVTSPSGDPVAAADVCVGRQPPRFRRRRGARGEVEAWTPLATSTDAGGRFHLPSVAPGTHPVAIRARGQAIWKGEVIVRAAETSHLQVRLPAGVVVHGVVTDRVGKPIAGALVRAYDKVIAGRFMQMGQFDYKSMFGFPFGQSDAQGRYRVTGIAAGSIYLYATPPRLPGTWRTLMRARTVMQGEAGQELLWNPVIEPGPSVSGLVTYKDGVPMQRCFINLIDEKTRTWQVAYTGKEGRFRFTNLEPASYTVEVQYHPREAPKGTPRLRKHGVRPDSGEVRLQASFDRPGREPAGIVRGRIQDAGGRRIHPGPFGVLLEARGSWRTGVADRDGVFQFERVPPGRRRLVVMSGEQQIHTTDWFQVVSGQKHDAGTLVTRPGGSLRIRVLRGKGTGKVEPRMYLRHRNTGRFLEFRIGTAHEHRLKSLSVGSYQVRVSRPGLANVIVNAEVRIGQEAVVDVPLRLGLTRVLTMTWPAGAGKLDIAIREDGGGLAREESYQVSGWLPRFNFKVSLPAGRFTIRARTDKGDVCERSFVVRAGEETTPPIPVDLKPPK